MAKVPILSSMVVITEFFKAKIEYIFLFNVGGQNMTKANKTNWSIEELQKTKINNSFFIESKVL